MVRTLDGVAHTRRVVIDAVPSGGNGRQRRPSVDSETARLRRLQKPVAVVQKRSHDGKPTLAHLAFRDTPAGLLERARYGDDGARARLLELVGLGLAVEHARRKRAES
jgi:hypothetical protein